MSQLDVRRKRKTNLFTNDLRSLMYAFGDVQNPYNESVAVFEDILQEYIINICHEAHRVARTANRQKIKVDDFKFALRNDERKLGRVEELLVMQREINEARKTFDNSEGKSLSKNYVDKKDNSGNSNSNSTDKEKERERERERGREREREREKEKEKDNRDQSEDGSQPRKVGRPKKYKSKEKKEE